LQKVAQMGEIFGGFDLAAFVSLIGRVEMECGFQFGEREF